MISTISHLFGGVDATPAWSDKAPVREELFGVERLEQHAESLAAAQPVTDHPPTVLPLRARLNANATALLAAYRASAAELESGQGVVPAADWLLDNYHLVEEQIREIRDDLPAGYYRQLPKLAEGPFAGYPRVFGIAWAYVAHTDSHFDPDILRKFIRAYQRVQPLTIGELWAVAITLRIVLVENLRRLADQITAGRAARADAQRFVEPLLRHGAERSALQAELASRSSGPLSELFAAHLAKGLRDQDPRTNPALDWLDDRLRAQGSSVGEAVEHAQQRQGASNVSIRNVITSMRLISDIDWAELFESVSLVDDRLGVGGAFPAMDFPTRNLYRSAIEQLARGSALSELEIADRAIVTAGASAGDARAADAGHHLIAGGRLAFEASIGFRPTPRLRFNRLGVRLGVGGYVGGVLAVAAGLIALALWALAGAGAGWLALFAVVAFLPATDAATALVNRVITWSFGPTILPGLELAAGVPRELRTLVAVPTLLTGADDLLEQIERLEVHHLSGAGGDIVFALVTDGMDADAEQAQGDGVLLDLAARSIARLNRRHGPAPSGDRFHLLHRRRVFDASEGRWMGWERKRGKLHELNRLLRGATDTTFIAVAGHANTLPQDVRFVITLDADTRLPRDAALKLIGKMAHPLNRPTLDAADQRVIDGYAILQPRVTPSLPIGREGSLYQRAFSSPGGIDPYAAAVSDVYQDLFGEGTYTGKGIYDIDAFEAALAGRVPDDAMLSHDLFEGVFARAGLATDVEVVEDFPSRYDVVGRRQHRWTRGDWQLLPWLFGRVAGRSAVPAVGRAKMLDNLRRSMLAPTTLAAFAVCWLAPPEFGVRGAFLVVGLMTTPALLPILFDLIPRRAGVRLRSHAAALGADIRIAAVQTFLTVAFLPDQAWRMGDAVVRTLSRVYVTRRRLLEWTTAAAMTASNRLDLFGFVRTMAGGVALALGLAAAALAFAPGSWPLILPFAALWFCAPAFALWASRSPSTAPRLTLSDGESRDLRLIARRTWRFFETFVTPSENALPPDNFQESPKPVVARRTSPTNIGLYLLSAVAARDFGWAGAVETVERLEDTIHTLRQLPRFRGHFFNWYGTADLAVLEPAYVSSVDSGNLAGHLIALANACEEWTETPPDSSIREGLKDNLDLARIASKAATVDGGGQERRLGATFDEIEALLTGAQEIGAVAPTLIRLVDRAAKLAGETAPTGDDGASDLLFWVGALRRGILADERDRREAAATPADLGHRFRSVAQAARDIALAMDFAFLIDPERKLLSIGFSVPDNRLDPSCYDLLASEARLASLFAIA
ncbi:MAG TPA: glycosyl transferase, partial [Hansschlegelia sp.]